jgi:hypothetical protein
VKTKTISPFGEIIKNINIRNYREKMRFPVKKTNFSRHRGNLKPLSLQLVLPLVLESLPTPHEGAGQVEIDFVQTQIPRWIAGGFDDLQEVCLGL